MKNIYSFQRHVYVFFFIVMFFTGIAYAESSFDEGMKEFREENY